MRRLSVAAVPILLCVSSASFANTYGSVEPVPNPAVLDTSALRGADISVRIAFAERVKECGVIDEVVDVLNWSEAISTVNELNTSFAVTAGGFAGATNPAYGYQIIDSGPNSASFADINVLTNSLGFVFSQGSAFLLDSDNPGSYAFPANYAVVNFPEVPEIGESAAFFELVGTIDPEIFETGSSGYTQYGNSYLTLQSFVPDQQFIDGYVAATNLAGLEYTPVVNGVPGLFQGGADFPFNDWSGFPDGDQYLGRIPAGAHEDLMDLREAHLAFVERALRIVERGRPFSQIRRIERLRCTIGDPRPRGRGRD